MDLPSSEPGARDERQIRPEQLNRSSELHASRLTWRASIRVALPIIGFIAAIAVVALGARWASVALATHPTIATLIVYALAAAGGLGGLLGFGYVASSIEFALLGYQIRRVARSRCAYEERDERGTIRAFRFEYLPLAKDYRPPCVAWLPSEERWNAELPRWARERRVEIVERIAKSLVSYRGVPAQVLDEHQRVHD